jgi:hypothetical protein
MILTIYCVDWFPYCHSQMYRRSDVPFGLKSGGLTKIKYLQCSGVSCVLRWLYSFLGTDIRCRIEMPPDLCS